MTNYLNGGCDAGQVPNGFGNCLDCSLCGVINFRECAQCNLLTSTQSSTIVSVHTLPTTAGNGTEEGGSPGTNLMTLKLVILCAGTLLFVGLVIILVRRQYRSRLNRGNGDTCNVIKNKAKKPTDTCAQLDPKNHVTVDIVDQDDAPLANTYHGQPSAPPQVANREVGQDTLVPDQPDDIQQSCSCVEGNTGCIFHCKETVEGRTNAAETVPSGTALSDGVCKLPT
ncbi:uncharacterized protein [Ptychodera flava]|uniref:uncharacterized protein n=1 Tax=Ptychodera flava TaxID=63121 RepID=UPI003969EC8E